ncbi:MAG: 3'(2'),5'-bisphosphate nucleotidase CysQ [Chlorobiaceae bacterium]|nr:3'(2'),5'-bisphosphate nucleotidase CysQ [Chlorobiaceae bacterium]
MVNKHLTSIAVDAAKKAGQAILTYYRKELPVEQKNDGSPLTLADQASHSIISVLLAETGIPVVSEEGVELHMSAERYWLVDPLDGTKDFLAANDEFTVNIALIENERVIIGVLYAPALDELYVGIPGDSFLSVKLQGIAAVYPSTPKSTEPRMAISRFHDHSDAALFVAANQVKECIPVGSALKFGRLSIGAIDVYPRLVGTSEWDTAAGQAILEASGGHVLDLDKKEPMLYGKANRRNGRFIAFRWPYKASDFDLTILKRENS